MSFVPSSISIVVNDTLAAKLALPAPPKTNVSTLDTFVKAKAAIEVTINLSEPSPPSIVSALVKALPMLIVSTPAPPLMLSAPPDAPLIESLPAPPEMMSLPAPPVIVSKPLPPVTFKTRVDVKAEPSTVKFSFVRSVAAPEVRPPSNAAALIVKLLPKAPVVMTTSRPAVAVVSPPSTIVIVSTPFVRASNVIAAGASPEAVKLMESAPVPPVTVAPAKLVTEAFTVKATLAEFVTVSPIPKFTVVALV